MSPSATDVIATEPLSQPSNDASLWGRTSIATSVSNPSLQVTADHKLKLVEAPVYAPKKGEVMLHIKATGVCGYVVVHLRC